MIKEFHFHGPEAAQIFGDEHEWLDRPPPARWHLRLEELSDWNGWAERVLML